MGGCIFVVTFCLFNIECNRGLRSRIFYDELVILECDSRQYLSCYFFRYPNLVWHQTIINSEDVFKNVMRGRERGRDWEGEEALSGTIKEPGIVIDCIEDGH